MDDRHTMAQAPERDDHVRGILMILTAMLLVTVQDFIIKSLSGEYPLHQVVLSRAWVAMLICLVIVKMEGGFHLLKTRILHLHFMRGMLVVGANSFYFLGLATMSVPEAMAIFFIAPLFITILSIPFLGEKVGIRRWVAVFCGMVGVIIMLRPGVGVFNWAALLPVVAALCYASLQISTRRLGVTEKASTMAFYIQVVFILSSLSIGLVAGDGSYAGSGHPSLEFLLRAWKSPPLYDFMLMMGCGALIGVGGYFMTNAYRITKATTVAPFEYVAIPTAVVITFFLTGDLPDWTTVCGILLIAGSGLFVFYRENVKSRSQARQDAERDLPEKAGSQ